MIPCKFQGRHFHPDQTVSKYVCWCKECPRYRQSVVDQQCDSCPYRATSGGVFAARLKEIDPPVVENARKFIVESTGAITYDKEEKDWEPPRDINGFQRDPANPWRFIPEWQNCIFIGITTVRYENCGCINVFVRCSNPSCAFYTKSVTPQVCHLCKLRREQ